MADAIYSYDPMGRIITEFQCTPLTCGTTSVLLTFGYDFLGNLTSSYNNEDNTTYTNSYDAAGRLTKVQSSRNDSQHPGTLITYSNFNAFQKPQAMTFGNGVGETLNYTNRLQLYSMNQTGTIYAFNILTPTGASGYAPNGNILFSNDSFNGNWAYTYDDFNRVISGTCSANCPGAAGFTYAYDRFGNRYFETVTAGSGVQPGYYFDANNHISISNVTYDAAGNVTNDGIGLGNSYTYDAENRIIAASNGYTASYVYDAFGHRVRSTVNGQNRDFIYDLNGRTIDQITAGSLTRSEDYAGGAHIATYANGTTTFAHSDWLGTERARSNVSGAKVGTCTSLPFGEDLTCTGTQVSPLQFTGQEHDSESGNDHFPFRYYGETMARFMTPDPLLNSGHPSNPQTWNRYSYALNNPLKIVDPNGLYNVNCEDDKQCKQAAKDLKKGLADLQKKVDKMKDSDQKTRLEHALTSMGTENDGNNVTVKFASLPANVAGQTDPTFDSKTNTYSGFTVTFDPSHISGGTNYWGIDAAHEGTHVGDYEDPLGRSLNLTTAMDAFQYEYRGYQTSAWAAQALGVTPLQYADSNGTNVIWNSSWAAADRQTLMDHGITNHVTSIPDHPENPIHNPWPDRFPEPNPGPF